MAVASLSSRDGIDCADVLQPLTECLFELAELGDGAVKDRIGNAVDHGLLKKFVNDAMRQAIKCLLDWCGEAINSDKVSSLMYLYSTWNWLCRG